MEFDRSKILTVVTAGQAKVGQKGWFASNVETLSRLVREEPPKELLGFNSNNAVHAFKTVFQNHALFYPAPEPTYEERQAEWVAKNNVKVGTNVRFTKGFKTAEDGSRCCEHGDAKGIEGVVSSVADGFLLVRIPNDGWAVPFTALEVIKEPTYRPFADAEEFAPHRDEWFRVKCSGGFERITFYTDYGVIDAKGQLISYAELFDAGECENGEPCGVKEI